MAASTVDYIVVGGGTAGAIVAARLMEANQTVAIVEAGPSDEGEAHILAVSEWQALLETELDFDYPILPQPRSNSHIRHARGKMLGGSSSHNSVIAFWPPDVDLEIWEAQGAQGWGPEGMRASRDRLQHKITLERAGPVNALGCAFVAACQEFGFPLLNFNGALLKAGVGYFDLNKQGNRRMSSSVAYLHPLAQWGARLQLVTRTSAQRILIDKGRAIGVDLGERQLFAEAEVIVCAGAFDTPKLLMLSGIGPPEHLKAHGIPVHQAHPGVGANLVDHPESVIGWEAAQPVPPETTQFWEIGLFATTRPTLAHPDLMFHFGTQLFDTHTLREGYPTAVHGFSLTPNVARARSQGTVRLASADPAAVPLIDFQYFTDSAGEDERVLVEGLKLARQIAAQPALRPWIKRELFPGAHVRGEAHLSAYARQVANTVYHPAGTCRLGSAGDETTVVTPDCRVSGVEGLRVADASLFPTMIGVNPCLTVMMIGEKCAEMILGP